jgi:hypothetical protein
MWRSFTPVALALQLCSTPAVAGTKTAELLCPVVVPGSSIGPVSLGAPPRAVGRLGLPKGLYEVSPVEAGPVSNIELNLRQATCFMLEGRKISTNRSAEGIALQIGGCGPAEGGQGANNLPCRNGIIGLTWSNGDLWLRVAKASGKRPTQQICDAYVVPGSHLATAGGDRKVEPGQRIGLPVETGKRYCWSEGVITSAWKEANVWKIPARSCSEKKQRGETTLSCDYWGVSFVFRGSLRRIEVYPAKDH